MAPPTKLTTDTSGKSDTPFARLPRQHRLKLQGRADETEEASEKEDGDGSREGKAAQEKKRMRGKNKAMKRYLRKQRKNVVDPKAARISFLRPFIPTLTTLPSGGTPREAAEREGTTEESQRCGKRRTGRQTSKCSRPFPDLDHLAYKGLPSSKEASQLDYHLSISTFVWLCCPAALVFYQARCREHRSEIDVIYTKCAELECNVLGARSLL